MNPEDRARQDIDRQLGQCGWVVQDKGRMNISAALGVAVRGFPLLPMTSSASSKLGRKRVLDRVESAMGKQIARDLPQPQVEDFGDYEEDDTVEEELVA